MGRPVRQWNESDKIDWPRKWMKMYMTDYMVKSGLKPCPGRSSRLVIKVQTTLHWISSNPISQSSGRLRVIIE